MKMNLNVQNVTWMRPSKTSQEFQDFEIYFNLTLVDNEDYDEFSWFEDKDGNKCASTAIGAIYKEAQFPLSMKQVNNFIAQSFTSDILPLLMDEDIKKELLYKYGKVRAIIMQKTKGETFIASEHTKEYFDEVSETWKPAQQGAEYLIYKNGYRFDYDTPIEVTFDIPILERIAIKNVYADKLKQLSEADAKVLRAKKEAIQRQAEAEAEAEAQGETEAQAEEKPKGKKEAKA